MDDFSSEKEGNMIETKSLCVGYGTHRVLQDVNLTFQAGKVTVLAGPNGCGKSTLLKTVLGLQPKLSGEILYNDVALEELKPRQAAQKAAFLTQSRNTPNISVERLALHGRFPYLSFPRHYRTEDYTVVNRALQAVDAEEFRQRMMQELSGGQRQKAYFAMTLAQDTPAVFLDEPTVYLDIAHQFEILELVRTLAADGRAVVMVLHDLTLAMKTADRLVILADGGVFYNGTPERAFETDVFERVFHVNLKRLETDEGWQYYYCHH